MDILIAAVGKLRRGPERDIIDTYLRRLRWTVTIREIDVPGQLDPATRKLRESERLLRAIPEGAALVALDRAGHNMTSEDFAGRLGSWRDSGRRVAFLIGGAEGLDSGVLGGTDLTLAFGTVTWPHMLARCMLVEQIYRAHEILAGHPYHRA